MEIKILGAFIRAITLTHSLGQYVVSDGVWHHELYYCLILDGIEFESLQLARFSVRDKKWHEIKKR
jgi:hypothetical protein